MDLVVRLKLSDRKVLYIGDGISDFAPASIADMVFAVKGSTLEKNVAMMEWHTDHLAILKK